MKSVVIGAGRMGRRHIRAARDLGLEVAGILDESEAALALASKEEGIPASKHFRDPRALLEATRPDVVIVATTAPAHAPLTLLAAEAGIPFVLCEKPMAVSLAECDRMIEACARSGTRLAINHQMRFMEQYTEPKRLLASAELGGLTSVLVAAGNMGLVMNGTHYFEMLRFMSEERPAHVSAWLSSDPVPNPRGPQFQDRGGCVVVMTTGGTRLVLECDPRQGHGVKTLFSARLGQVFVDELAGLVYATVREAQYRDLPTTRYGMPSVNTLRTLPPPDMVVLSRRVLEALIRGQDAPSGSDGRLAVATAVAAHVSHERGNVPVAIDDALPQERVFPWA